MALLHPPFTPGQAYYDSKLRDIRALNLIMGGTTSINPDTITAANPAGVPFTDQAELDAWKKDAEDELRRLVASHSPFAGPPGARDDGASQYFHTQATIDNVETTPDGRIVASTGEMYQPNHCIFVRARGLDERQFFDMAGNIRTALRNIGCPPDQANATEIRYAHSANGETVCFIVNEKVFNSGIAQNINNMFATQPALVADTEDERRRRDAQVAERAVAQREVFAALHDDRVLATGQDDRDDILSEFRDTVQARIKAGKHFYNGKKKWNNGLENKVTAAMADMEDLVQRLHYLQTKREEAKNIFEQDAIRTGAGLVNTRSASDVMAGPRAGSRFTTMKAELKDTKDYRAVKRELKTGIADSREGLEEACKEHGIRSMFGGRQRAVVKAAMSAAEKMSNISAGRPPEGGSIDFSALSTAVRQRARATTEVGGRS